MTDIAKRFNSENSIDSKLKFENLNNIFAITKVTFTVIENLVVHCYIQTKTGVTSTGEYEMMALKAENGERINEETSDDILRAAKRFAFDRAFERIENFRKMQYRITAMENNYE